MINEQDFLKPETRCDFYVSEKRKKVWKVELDILADFIGICQRHDLKYFLFAGSMLGAVRHQGIIPWDDDIDVAMPREDYEKLLQIAPEELQEQHVLVTPNNSERFCPSFSKIYNKNTTALEACYWEYQYTFPQGIFLDIFPFDNVPDSGMARKLQHLKIKFLRVLQLMKNDYHIDGNRYGQCTAIAFSVLGRLVSWINAEKLMKLHYKVTTKYNKGRTKVISPISNGYELRNHCLTEWAEELIDVPFEYLTVKILKQYDAYLTNQFGNWHEFVRGTSCHNGIFFDPDRPYTEYLGRFEEFKDASREL